MHPFSDLAEVEVVLEELMERTPPIVTRLPRQPGRKEPRNCHLFAGEPDTSAAETQPESGAARSRAAADNGQLDRLEVEVVELRQEVADLRQIVADFKKSFE